MNRMLDQQAAWAEERRLIKGRVKPVALDSSMFESRHVSRHFEKRCKQTAASAAKAARRKKRPETRAAAAAAARTRRR